MYVCTCIQVLLHYHYQEMGFHPAFSNNIKTSQCKTVRLAQLAVGLAQPAVRLAQLAVRLDQLVVGLAQPVVGLA